VELKVRASGGWDEFRTVAVPGRLRLGSGRQAIQVLPRSKPAQALGIMNLRRVELHPVVNNGVDPTNGRIDLPATFADIHGDTARLELIEGVAHIGYWADPSDYLTWDLFVPKAGAYQVLIEHACARDSASGTFRVSADGQAGGVVGKVAGTDGWAVFETITLPGTLRLEAGRQAVYLKPLTMGGFALMNLRRITLKPQPPGQSGQGQH
jgi:alpha-L-fucosidase